MRYTLGKKEKLKSSKLIEQLFKEGKRINSNGIQLIYLKAEHGGDFPVKVGFSVPKRQTKLAVDRNRLKRKMREAYRKNKYGFVDTISKQFIFMFIYTSKEEISYHIIEEIFLKIQSKFVAKNKENETQN
jgi:ribonuclease P protein component